VKNNNLENIGKTGKSDSKTRFFGFWARRRHFWQHSEERGT